MTQNINSQSLKKHSTYYLCAYVIYSTPIDCPFEFSFFLFFFFFHNTVSVSVSYSLIGYRDKWRTLKYLTWLDKFNSNSNNPYLYSNSVKYKFLPIDFHDNLTHDYGLIILLYISKDRIDTDCNYWKKKIVRHFVISIRYYIPISKN